MTVVVDASVVAAALLDSGPVGTWAEAVLVAGPLIAPHLMPAEVANVLRRAVLAADVSPEAAGLAYADLIELPVQLLPFEPFAARVWALRNTVTAYDAWYVALAESFGAELATLDSRLARASGPGCAFLTPPG